MSNLPRIFKLAAAVAAGVVCMSISDNVSSLRQANLVTTADARVGRPLTPMSVAGVSRRTTRRAVVRDGAYYGAAYYGTRAYGGVNRVGVGAGYRPGYGLGYRRGYGLGAAAVAGAALGSGYYTSGAYDAYASANYGTGDAYILHGTYISESDAVAYCAQQFRSYDVESRTFVAYSGQRVSCPQ